MNKHIIHANLAKRSGAAILDFIMALLLWLTLITYVFAPIYNELYDTRTLQDDYTAIQLESQLYVTDPETEAVTYVATAAVPAAIYDYYAEFKDGKTYIDETDAFLFTNQWYNETILKIGSTDPDVTVLFEYDVDGLEVPDPSLPGVPKADVEEATLTSFYAAAYSAAQIDLSGYTPYAELAALISKYSLEILIFSGLIAISIFYLAVPLILKNGQTLAKKMLNLGVTTNKGYKLKWWQTVVRFVAFAAEIVLSVYTILGAILISYTLMIFTKNNRSAHDFIAQTAVVNLKTSLLFANEEEVAAYENKLAADEAALSSQRLVRPAFEDKPVEIVAKPLSNEPDTTDHS